MNSSKDTYILPTILGFFCKRRCQRERTNLPLSTAVASSPSELHSSAAENSACMGRKSEACYLYAQDTSVVAIFTNSYLCPTGVTSTWKIFSSLCSLLKLCFMLSTISAIITFSVFYLKGSFFKHRIYRWNENFIRFMLTLNTSLVGMT